ncbi:MAG: hypothetical protein KIS81_06175 [Maricaulaceae bacterium]|nr:hypothetical protein [Maricaulaceae bacterium]
MRRFAILVLFAASAALQGCGFTPLYAAPGAGGDLRSIAIEARGQTRFDHLLEQALLDRFGAHGQEARSRLELQTRIGSTRLGVGADNVASRNILRARVRYALYEPGGTRPVLTGTATAEAPFDLPGDPYAAAAAQREAEQRLAEDAAQRVALQVMRHAGRSARSAGRPGA